MSESVFYSVQAVRRISDRIVKEYKEHYTFPENQEGFSPEESHIRDVLVDVLHEELNRLPSFMEWDAKNGLYGKCCCVAGLPDPECPQHGVHSLQASEFYDNAYRANIQSKCAQLTGTLHRELLDTGLVTVQQWNDKIAPALVTIDQAVETPRAWAERTVAPLTPWGEIQKALIDLVRLKDLKMWIESGTAPDHAKTQYEREKEPAWEAARIALEHLP